MYYVVEYRQLRKTLKEMAMNTQISTQEKKSALFGYMEEVITEMIENGKTKDDIDIKEVANIAFARMVQFEQKMRDNIEVISGDFYNKLNA